MATVSIDDVWLYVHDRGEVRTRDLEHAFVKSQKISRSTLYKYKRILQAQGKIVSKFMLSHPITSTPYPPIN
jgi:ACT domain-containing protein